MKPEEWDELCAYYAAEPFGEFAADVRAAKLAAITEPSVDVGEFLKTPGERREGERESDESDAGLDAFYGAIIAKQAAEAAKG